MRACSVKVNSQAGNIRAYIMTPEMAQGTGYLAQGLKNLRILSENSAGMFGSRRERCRGYVHVFENTLEKLILKSIFPLKFATTLVRGSRKGAVRA